MCKCHIQIAPHYHHSLVFLELKTDIQPPRRPGFQKFNCSLLENCDNTEKMAPKIPQFTEGSEYLDDKGLLWEMVKMEIRSFTMCFAKIKAKRREDQEKILTQGVGRLQKLIDVQPTTDNINCKTEIRNPA